MIITSEMWLVLAVCLNAMSLLQWCPLFDVHCRCLGVLMQNFSIQKSKAISLLYKFIKINLIVKLLTLGNKKTDPVSRL